MTDTLTALQAHCDKLEERLCVWMIYVKNEHIVTDKYLASEDACDWDHEAAEQFKRLAYETKALIKEREGIK